MQIQRLAWAGIKVASKTTTLLVDAIADPNMTGFQNEPLKAGWVVPPGEEGSIHFAAITHLHSDHYDRASLKKYLAPGGKVLCWAPSQERVESHGFLAVGLNLHESFSAGDLVVTPVPAVDGIGSQQVSWIIDGEGKRIIHCGDTLWHGYWWSIAKQYAPIDAAFFPMNGPLVNFENVQPASRIPIVMTPEQAVNAALALQAKAVCPIHYGLFNSPGVYDEYPDALQVFQEMARARRIVVQAVQPGGYLQW